VYALPSVEACKRRIKGKKTALKGGGKKRTE
jgi:hypothetical protein